MAMAHKISNRKQITVDTANFEFAHGRKPSGNGFWHFEADTKEECATFQGSGNYSAVKANAVKWAQENGHYRIIVGS